MASIEKTVEIIFSGQNNLTDVLGQISENYGAIEGSINDIGEAIEELPNLKEISIDAQVDASSIDPLREAIEGLPNLKEIAIDAHVDGTDITSLERAIEGLPNLKAVNIDVQADRTSLDAIERAIAGLPNTKEIEISTLADASGIDPLRAAIEGLPAVKKIDISVLSDETSITTIERAISDLPPTKQIAIDITAGGFDGVERSLESINQAFNALPDSREIGVSVLPDLASIERAYGAIIERFPDGAVRITNVGVEADQGKLDATWRKIDEAFPKEKPVEIQAKLDVQKIKSDADIVRSVIEWKAKLDIAEVEANAKVIISAFQSIDNTITSTGTTLSSAVGAYADLVKAGQGGTNVIEDQMRKENERRDQALTDQRKLIDAEVELIKQKTESLKGGQAMIQIDGKGLQPQLEAFMFEILAAVQVKANAEGMKMLVGI